MDFVFGILLYGRFSLVSVLGIFLMFGFYLISFLCTFKVKAGDLSKIFCSKYYPNEVCASNIMSCKSEPLKLVENLQSPYTDGIQLTKLVRAEDLIEGKDDDDDENVCCKENQVFDVLSLRKMVKIERRRGNEALAELEKERMAAAFAVEEAMTMILRLQNEKSSTEIQANHYHQIAKQKQQYDEAVIQSLQWIIKKHESERIVLEKQLKLCKQKCNG